MCFFLSLTADFDHFDVEHRFVRQLEWKDSTSDELKKVRVYRTAASRWNSVAECLGLEPGEIQSIRQNHFSDDERVMDVFRCWFNSANKEKYPKKWSGLIRLLKDSELGELSDVVKTALSAPYSNVRCNLY